MGEIRCQQLIGGNRAELAADPIQVKKSFIDEHRHEYGVEPICRVLQIAPSTYHEHVARQADPSRAPARVQRDAWLRAQIRRVWEESFQLYGIRKVWHQLWREGIRVARCTVERLMRNLGIEGVRRDKPVKTTVGATIKSGV